MERGRRQPKLHPVKDPAAVALGARGGQRAWKGLNADQRAEIMRDRWETRRKGWASGKRPRAKGQG